MIPPLVPVMEQVNHFKGVLEGSVADPVNFFLRCDFDV